MVTRSKLHTEDQQTLGATGQNGSALATWLFPGTFHPPIYITYPEDNGSKFLRNVGIFPSDYSGLRIERGRTLRLRQGEARNWSEFSKFKKQTEIRQSERLSGILWRLRSVQFGRQSISEQYCTCLHLAVVTLAVHSDLLYCLSRNYLVL